MRLGGEAESAQKNRRTTECDLGYPPPPSPIRLMPLPAGPRVVPRGGCSACQWRQRGEKLGGTLGGTLARGDRDTATIPRPLGHRHRVGQRHRDMSAQTPWSVQGWPSVPESVFGPDCLGSRGTWTCPFPGRTDLTCPTLPVVKAWGKFFSQLIFVFLGRHRYGPRKAIRRKLCAATGRTD